MGKYDKILAALEKLLPEGSSMAEQVALRNNPEKYAEYLKTLDKLGPKEQRAAEMGFGSRDWYHGTTVDIPEFKKDAQGLSTNAQSAKKGFFFAEDPLTAADYAELARDKGIIREGDNVTTKGLSENHMDPEKLGYSHYKNAEKAWMDAKSIPEQNKKNLQNIKGWEKQKINPEPWIAQAAQREGFDSIEKYVDSKISKYVEKNPIREPLSKTEIENLKKQYFISIDEFAKSNDPDYVGKIFSIDMDKKMPPDELKAFADAQKKSMDIYSSQGQQVGQYRLRGNPHVKNYKGEPYRDTTYADEMTKAQEKGKDSVLFKNTYDPGDPNNRVVKQDIAAVFEPNQIRSTNAAFDPRFKSSPYVLAGAGAVPKGILESGYDDFKENVARPLTDKWEQLKGYITDPLSKQLDLTKDKSAASDIKSTLNMVGDPLNYIPGAPGVAAGAIQMLGTQSEEEKAKREALRKMADGEL